MEYQQFKTALEDSLREAELKPLGQADETIDVRTLGRKYEIEIELPMQDAEPFRVAATMWWEWTVIRRKRVGRCVQCGRDSAGMYRCIECRRRRMRRAMG